MLFKDFELKEGNYFIAMEYYFGILNRTFLILLTDSFLLGLKVNGVVGTGLPGDLNDRFSYTNDSYVDAFLDEDIYGASILSVNKANFKINKTDIIEVNYDPRKKWGMGPYPHDGKIYIKTNDEKTREFIILGDQSGDEIKNLILGTKSNFNEKRV
jgi:hypothetical protein